MAVIYGWTLPEIDALGDAGRQRVRYMWAVSATFNEAQRYLDEWMKKQGATAQTLAYMKASKR